MIDDEAAAREAAAREAAARERIKLHLTAKDEARLATLNGTGGARTKGTSLEDFA